MPIRFRCAYCSQLMGIAQRKAGTVVRCPKCSGQVVVPAKSEPGMSVTPPPPTSSRRPADVLPAPGSVFEFAEVEAILPPSSTPKPTDDEPFDVVPLGGPGTSGYFITTRHLLLAGILIVVLLVLTFFLGWILRGR